MTKNVFDNGGYLGVPAALGVSPALYFKGWNQRIGSGTVTMPSNGTGDLLIVVGLYGFDSNLPPGWSLASYINGGCFVAYKYATSDNETSGTWGGPNRMYSMVFSGAKIGSAATYNQFPYVASGTALNCPALASSNTTGTAMRFRFISTRTQSAQAATWSTPIPTGHTSLYEVNATYNATRFFRENSTYGAASSDVVAGVITLNSGDYTYYSSATVEVKAA